MTFSFVDQRNPIVEFCLIEMRGNGGLQQEVDGECRHVKDFLEATICVPAYN